MGYPRKWLTSSIAGGVALGLVVGFSVKATSGDDGDGNKTNVQTNTSVVSSVDEPNTTVRTADQPGPTSAVPPSETAATAASATAAPPPPETTVAVATTRKRRPKPTTTAAPPPPPTAPPTTKLVTPPPIGGIGAGS